MSDNATHDPKKYVVRVAGYRVTGFANGTGFNSTMAQPRAEVVVGNNGLAAYSITHSNAATITLTLMPGSDANDIFASILTADALAGRLVPLWLGTCSRPLYTPRTTGLAEIHGHVWKWNLDALTVERPLDPSPQLSTHLALLERCGLDAHLDGHLRLFEGVDTEYFEG